MLLLLVTASHVLVVISYKVSLVYLRQEVHWVFPWVNRATVDVVVERLRVIWLICKWVSSTLQFISVTEVRHLEDVVHVIWLRLVFSRLIRLL